MSEFVKDSELTLLKASFKRCISSAEYKAKRIKANNPELADLVDAVLLDLDKVVLDWSPIGRALSDKLSDKDE